LRDLGVEVGLSESAVHRRLGRLRRSGVLARVVALLEPRRLTPVMTSIVLVALDRDSATAHAAFRERMRAEGRVQQCYSIVGQRDYVVVLVTRGSPRAGPIPSSCSWRRPAFGGTRRSRSRKRSRSAWSFRSSD
jgi:DNA-binding Lrp family transcriptional regulator